MKHVGMRLLDFKLLLIYFIIHSFVANETLKVHASGQTYNQTELMSLNGFCEGLASCNMSVLITANSTFELTRSRKTSILDQCYNEQDFGKINNCTDSSCFEEAITLMNDTRFYTSFKNIVDFLCIERNEELTRLCGRESAAFQKYFSWNCSIHNNKESIQNDTNFDESVAVTFFMDECTVMIHALASYLTSLSSACQSGTSISEDHKLIFNTFLRIFVWLTATSAFFGNLIVIFGELKSMPSLLKGPIPLRTNHMLILNLATADFLMGIYLIMLGISDLLFLGTQHQCNDTIMWRSSHICTTMGVLAAISTECSIITITLLTSFRLYGILKPFAAIQNPKLPLIISVILVTWILSTFLALVPLFPNLQNVFVDEVFVPTSTFLTNLNTTFGFAKDWAKYFGVVRSNHSLSVNGFCLKTKESGTWEQLQGSSDLKNMNFLDDFYFLGYYSSTKICLPKLFATPSYKGWGFSLAITIVNFVCFTYIAIAYFFIAKSSGNVLEKQETSTGVRGSASLSRMHMKVLVLVVTNLSCWAPLSIRIFLNYAGVTTPDEAYDVSAIILFPINSGLNPIFYSTFVAKLCSRFKPKRFFKQKKLTLKRNEIIPMS